jgi:putative ABC transport system substrate-binding protein
MKRREFIALLGGATAAWPLAARAQQPAMPVVGFLDAGSAAERTPQVAAFRNIASVTAELAGKSVQLIPDMLPSARRVTVLANATDPFSKPFLEQIQLGGEATGTAINPIRISNNEEFESAFAAMERDRPDAIIVQPSLPSKRAAELALQHRVPAVSVPRWFADEGGLMSYSAIYADLFRKAAVYVDKILKGAQPADLPVEQPTRFQLVINMKTAKALGITVPATLLARADEVIE